MPLVVLPSEITEGPLPRQKCLRGFVVEKRRRTLASGKLVVELHVAAKNEPGEVYYLEAWGAVATRADTIGHKAYDFTKFIAKSAEGKALYTSSTAPTWGSLQGGSEWTEVNAADFPRSFPTTSLEMLKEIFYGQEVCVQCKFTELVTECFGGESTPMPLRRSRVKQEVTPSSTWESTDLSTAVVVVGEQSVILECWGPNHELIKDIPDGTALQINRVLWTVNKKKGGFVLRATAATSVTVLQSDAAKAVHTAASAAPIALSKKFDPGAARALQSEGKAKVTSLSLLASLLDKEQPEKALGEDLWEVCWVHIYELRNLKLDSEQLSYTGCKQCSSKDCQKHTPKVEVDCYSLQVGFQDCTGRVDAKCFTRVAHHLFEAISGAAGPFSDDDILIRMSETPFSVRFRVGYEDAWQTRRERNFFEVVAAIALPWTFKPQMRITALRGLGTGAPDVFLQDCSVNALGHLLVAKQRHGRVRFVAQLQGKARITAAPDNSGIRVLFVGLANSNADHEEEIELLWTVALEDIQPVMQLQDKDLLYISANATSRSGTWTVSTYKVISSTDRNSIVDAFKARAVFAAEVLNSASSDEVADPVTPMRRKQRLEQICSVTERIGMYDA